ncbi:nitric-oxide reductase large subunit [Gephyromycinifex aptenodytis]|uniref:nitric-oxide reductase large subunit n=1 Tax=Gephyromycinifex aptenodytis TaxID=2716227 RepID=UPI001D032878|nr:nitric-oxide reductase large subunit [Gephyromycinifex aptenodytis]
MATVATTHLDPAPPPRMSSRDRRWWVALVTIVLGSFAVLLWMGLQIQESKPPIPTRVVDASGQTLLGGDDVMDGQRVWQSIGGQQIGSVWGHGAYVAPDWTADWLHREAVAVMDSYAQDEGLPSYAAATPEQQAALKARMKASMRTNTYDPATGTITLDQARSDAFRANAAHYADIFTQGHERYAIPSGTVDDPEAMRQMNAFFWWSSWAASTDAPADDASYTRNWPHEPLIDNVPTPTNILWSMISFILLLGGIAGMVWYHNFHTDDDEVTTSPPDSDPLLGYEPTPSQKATLKYFFVVGAMFVLQIAMGILSAHYGVEGAALYGIPIDTILPYAVVRTWHTQLGILWIATAWLATGLYVAPAVGGREPKLQRLGVNILFGALVLVVAGSMVGQWFSITGRMGYGTELSWWLGTTGMEYLDLARTWQIGLFIGLFLWLFLMTRGMWPALRRARKEGHLSPTQTAPLAGGSQRTLIIMLLISCLAIASFFGAAFGMGHDTHLSITEYWRWWVVHLWVEGFFEVFATVVIAFLFSRLGLVRPAMSATATLAATTIFLLGGIIGTGHHLYFTGANDPVMAWSASFSALEVVPLALMGFEAFRNLRILRVSEWVNGYKWAIYFFVSVSFWNMLGAGVFGFLINPPISLFYVQGLNLTPLHAHTALFGVYGMLGIGLMLFCVRSLMPGREWNDWPLKLGFWAMNGGLFLMAMLSLLPLGLSQAWASISEGLWYARSSEFLYTPAMTVLRWMRTPGDVLFGVGALSIGLFMVGLLTGHSIRNHGPSTRQGSLGTDDEKARMP